MCKLEVDSSQVLGLLERLLAGLVVDIDCIATSTRHQHLGLMKEVPPQTEEGQCWRHSGWGVTGQLILGAYPQVLLDPGSIGLWNATFAFLLVLSWGMLRYSC